MSAWGVVLIALGATWSLLLLGYARRLRADWREPVLARPILILESDDWGPGPPEDGHRLAELVATLASIRDAEGHPPVCTLGVVLAVPQPVSPRQVDTEPRYVPCTLDDAACASILGAMRAGQRAGVLALQLHGKEHFWPPALLRAAVRDAAARAFLCGSAGHLRHESLPPHLQARWIDASDLPSQALDRDAIEKAVADETACFGRIFGTPARVVVPVTFTWTVEVEAAWSAYGIRVVVTPGKRNIGRDAQGRLVEDGTLLRNGDLGPDSLVYVVRDIYFEPQLGHKAESALAEVREHFSLGRPALLEMHRFNFAGDARQAADALAELRRLLETAIAEIRDLRFMSTEALAAILRAGDPAFVDRRWSARIRAFVRRAAAVPRLRKLAWVTGLAVPAIALYAAASGFRDAGLPLAGGRGRTVNADGRR